MKKHYILFAIVILIVQSISVFGQFGDSHFITTRTINTRGGISCDIDGDGHRDILTGSYKKISWFKNTDGMGEWGIPNIIDNDLEENVNVNFADIDSDGDNDVLCVSYNYQGSNTLSYYLNDGQGNFGEKQIVSTIGDRLYTVKSNDLDSDGDLDIIVVSVYDSKIYWFENTDGLGNFGSEQVISSTLLNAHDVFTVDINGDGNNDILSFSRNDSTVVWFDNTNGLGNFSNPIYIVDADRRVGNIYPSDIDGDNDIDIVFSNDTSIIWIENIDGNGDFSIQHDITNSIYAYGKFYSGDMDGDNDNDIAIISHNGTRIYWVENIDGLGNFSAPQLVVLNTQDYSGTYSLVSLSDVDGDGSKDIISTGTSHNRIAWYRNTDGNGTFGDQLIVSTSNYNLRDIIFSDIDGDSDIDVVSTGSENNVAWYENLDGLGGFGSQKVISTEIETGHKVFSIDIDGDGDNDVVSASGILDGKIAWYENVDGLGNFGIQNIVSPIVNAVQTIFCCDIDNDGDNDIIANYSSRTSWFENTDGLGTFTLSLTIMDNSWSSKALYVCDIDGDNDLDIINSYTGDDIVCYKNINGTGSFLNKYTISNNVGSLKYVIPSDIDNDGDLDLLSASTSKIAWYENTDGDGTFGPQQIISYANSHVVSAADMDDDGDIDVLSTSHTNIDWYENTDGLGSFSSENSIPLEAYSAYTSLPCDIDNDGDIDYLHQNPNTILWLENYLYGAKSKLKGKVFYDQNQNGIKDSLDSPLTYAQLLLNPIALASFTNFSSEFWFAVDTGSYVLSYNPIPNWSLTTDSSEYHVYLTANEPIIDSLDFGFYPSDFICDINPEITASPSVCGSEAIYWIDYLNQGTTTPDGIIELILDDSITFISSQITPDSILGQNIYWHFDSLNFFASEQIPIIVHVPDFNSMGDTLVSVFNIYATDSTGQSFFTDTLSEILACSYDPNDKLVTPRGDGVEGVISVDETLEYTVRFQNTGNAEAINIKIRDQIDANLDIESIQILAASDEVQAYVQQNRWLVFQFDSIMLPDSTANELESHGFVKFSIRADDSVLPNAQILNTAHIYFDYNPAVITNTVLNTIECFEAPDMPDISQNNDMLEIVSTDDIHWFFNGSEITNANTNTYQFTQNGDYSVIVIDANGCSTQSEIYTVTNVDIDNINSQIFSLYPNPTKESFIIKGVAGNETYKIYNLSGSLIQTGKVSKQSISILNYPEGVYIIEITSEEQNQKLKLIKE